MIRFKMLQPEEISEELREMVTDCLFGDEDLFSFFDEPHVDEMWGATAEFDGAIDAEQASLTCLLH